MFPALALLAVAAGCSRSARVAECDELVTLVDTLAKCPKIPAPMQGRIVAVRTKLEEMLAQLDKAGGIDEAPQVTQDALRKTCRSQHDAVALSYAQFAPDCVK